MASLQERDRRYAALRAMMQEQGWQALILAGNAEATQRGYVRYVSDWRLWGGKGFVVFPLHGEPALVLGAGSQSHWSKLVGWIEDVRPAQNMLTTVGEIVHALGLAQGEIGVVGMGQVMVYGDVLALQRGLPDARLIDATTAVDNVMAIRSSEEIAMQAESYRAVAQAHARLEQAFRPGRSERAAMAEAAQVLAELGCLDGIAHLTTDLRPFFRPPTDRLISADDIIKVSLEFAGPSGYWVELSAIYSFREPPARQLRYYETCVMAIERVKAMLRPGAIGSDVTRIVEATFAEDGWQVSGRGIWDGHLIGLNVIRPPYGLIDNRDVFQENMVFNVHPGLVVDDDGLGMFVQDNLLVTASGGKPLGEFEHRWRKID
jgi:Xaa-Pro aminopeptidase